MSRRVVITGIGIVSPLATGVEATWRALVAGHSAIAPVHVAELCAASGYPPATLAAMPVHAAARVARGTRDGEFALEHWVHDAHALGALRVSGTASAHFAIAAAAQALRDAQWLQAEAAAPALPQSASAIDALFDDADDEHARTGVSLGVGGVGSMDEISSAAMVLRDRGHSRVSAYFLPRILPNMCAAQVALHFKLRGPLYSPAAACATGAQSIGDAFRSIQRGEADVMVAGGADASLDALSIAGFVRCRALSAQRDARTASRPFHPQRDGFVMGEGAAVLILEEYEHARRRRAPRMHAEVLGFASRADPSHLTSPAADGAAAYRVMRAALADARCAPSDVDYVNAHATSTPAGDAAEALALRRLFGEFQPSTSTSSSSLSGARPPAVSSTKGATGHLLGAAGALETAICALATRDDLVPPCVHLGGVGRAALERGGCGGVDLVGVDAADSAVIGSDCGGGSGGGSSSDDAVSHSVQTTVATPSGASAVVPTGAQARAMRVRVALNNSFGFGGANACVVLGKAPAL